jgi:hypothetical protein
MPAGTPFAIVAADLSTLARSRSIALKSHSPFTHDLMSEAS